MQTFGMFFKIQLCVARREQIHLRTATALRGQLQSPNAMSTVCERGWGRQAADSDWSIRSPHPFWNGIRTSKVVTSAVVLKFLFSVQHIVFPTLLV
jgi:hypothetical protein